MTNKTKRKVGRPSLRTDAVIRNIIEGLSAGTPLTVVCREDGMPSPHTVYDWLAGDEVFSAEFARARELGFDAIAARLRETARGKGDSTFDVQRDKLIIETDLKLLAKWDPKRYGEMIKHAGADGGKLAILVSSEDAGL